MKNIIKKINFDKQIQKLNLNINEQKISKKSIKKILNIYIKGLKIFNLLNKKYISNWNGNSKKLFNIILPSKEKIIINAPPKPKKLSLLEKMQNRIQLNKIKNKKFNDDFILLKPNQRKSSLFIDYIISETNNQEKKNYLNQKFLLQKLDDLKTNINSKNEKILLDNNNNNNILIENNKLNILIDTKPLITNNLFQIINSNNLKSIYKWYIDKNKYNNLALTFNILKFLPNNLFSYKLLIKNYIENKINSNSYKSKNKLENFTLLFKGKSPINSIYKYKDLDKSKKISTRKYIKSLTTFNSKNAYYFSNNYNYKFFVSNNIIPKNIYIFLEYSFLSLSYLISKPIFEITPEKIIIHLFYYHIRPKKKVIRYKNRYNGLLKKKILYLRDKVSILTKKINRIKLQIISKILRQFFKKAIELEIVRLNYPFYNTNIFVNLLGKMVNKIKLRRILRRFFKKAKILNPTKIIGNKISKIPSFLSGVKIRVAGRLLTQRIIPRKTVKTISKGSLARGKVIYLEKSRFTNKNKRGAFSITVTTGHIT